MIKKRKKKQKNQSYQKKDLIILEKSKEKSKQEIVEILKKLSGDFQPIHAFAHDIVEIKGIGLLNAGSYLFNNNKNFSKKKHLTFVFTVMVSLEKFINVCQI